MLRSFVLPGFRLWLFCLIMPALLLVQACRTSSSSEALSIENRNFEQVISPQQNLVFTLSHDVAHDTLVGRWDTTQFVRIRPAVKGRYRWNSARELVFSPITGFAPGTDYTAELSTSVLGLAKKEEKAADGSALPTSISGDKIPFHTPYLQLLESSAFWTRPQGSQEAEQRLLLRFNYPVNPRDIAGQMQATVAGKPAQVQPISAQPSEEIVLVLQGPTQPANTDLPIQLKFPKGLPLMPGGEKRSEPVTAEVALPGRNKLEVQAVTAAYEASGPVIKVRLNQSLAAGQNLSQLVRTVPVVPIEVEEQEQGLVVKGDFLQGTTYQVRLADALTGLFGSTLGQEYQQQVVFGDLSPAIGFVAKKGFYLTPKGAKNLGLQITNVPQIKVTVYKIYQNNILAFMREGNRYSDYDSDYGDYGFEYMDLDDFGSIVHERTYETARLPKARGVQLLNLNFEEATSRQGFYVIKAESTSDQWLRDQKIVSLSDIGLIVRETPDEVVVFANSILSTDPLPNTEITLVSRNNQSLHTATTDKDGVARFTDLQKSAPGFSVAMITAQRDTDFNYLIFRSTGVETSRYEVGGARSNPTGYQAYVYGDRDIYRPGETIHLNTILRKETPNVPVSLHETEGLPIKLRLLLPNGREYKALRGKLNNQGAFATSIPVASSAVTGTYQLEVLSANDVLLASRYISIEEFIPDRIKVDLTTNAQHYKPGEQINASITATNLFGPPAALRNYEMQYTLQRKAFSPKALPDYTFAISGNERVSFAEVTRQGKTDAQGKASEVFEIPRTYQDNGLLQGSIFATVFDESGRPVNRIAKLTIATQPHFFGIRSSQTYLTPGQPADFGLAVVDQFEKPVAEAQAQLQLIRYNWQTVVERGYNGQFRYVSQRKEETLVSKLVTIRGTNGSFTFIPPGSGEYELRLYLPGASTYVSQRFYAYGYGRTQASSFEVNREGQVSIAFDKATYKPGDKAKVLFTTPFSGRLLVTVERNRVLEHFVLATDKKSAQLVLPIQEAHVPNVYLTATLIRPTDDSDMPLTVAHGFASMAVEEPTTKLPVQILAAAATRSQTSQTITVKTRPEANIQVTIAVVDEGILQLKNYKSPDPHAFFYQKRALEVQAYDLYAALLPELRLGKSSTGGDGYDLSRRVNPLTNKRVKLVSYWSGILRTNNKGEAQYKVDIPQFSGSLRVMAVAYKGASFGSASQAMQVADPIVLATGLPRFASPGDTLLVPVTVSNTTSAPAQATAQISTEGGFRVVGAQTQELAVPANSEGSAQFRVVAQQSIGTGKVTARVQALNETFNETTDLTIRPVTSLIKQSGSGEVAGGASAAIEAFRNNEQFMPGTMQTKLVLSRTPIARFTDDLSFLMQYPYGCLEQTISAAFPQLYFPDLAKSLHQAGKKPMRGAVNAPSPQQSVQEAARKAEGLQLHNGGLAMWPGLFVENWWASAYAAHFLTEAKAAGFEINQRVLDRLLLYLGQKVKGNATELLYYTDAKGQTNARTIVAKEVAYSLYVLALAGKPERAAMNRYKPQTAQLAIDSKYLLAAAYALIGDKESYRSLLPPRFGEAEKSVGATGGSFYSYVRDQGISLYALAHSEPNHPQVPELARRLSEQMQGSQNFSTQERVWAILALGKVARQSSKSTVTASVSANGKSVGEFTGETLTIDRNLAGQALSINTKGSGKLYYFWEISGTGTGPFKPEDNNLQVRRTYYDRNGKEIRNNTFAQNDLVVVKLTVRAANNAQVENVVVTDMLPAGFEIENPRVGAIAGLAWVKNAAQPEHFDIRDDRIHFFTSLNTANDRRQQHRSQRLRDDWSEEEREEQNATSAIGSSTRNSSTTVPGEKNFYYLVRAVSQGNFQLGPVSADAMYNGAYHSAWGAGTIRVKSRGTRQQEL